MRLLLLILICTSTFTQANTAKIENYWLQAAPPNAMMMAAYAELRNDSNKDITLVGAYSPAFKMTEIHKSVIENGIAKMIHQPKLVIKPSEKLILKPGSYHIMLMQPIIKFKKGDLIKINLIYQNGDKLEVKENWFPVEFR